jgi:hypothetical protein
MIPWLQIDTARVPGADVELRLMQRGAEFSMMLGSNELMNSRLSGSEQALATLACKRIRAVKHPHLLIGGLGMGFTLHAALAVLGTEARIMVAELLPAVIAWARGPMANIFGDSLDDPRTTILSADVIERRALRPGGVLAVWSSGPNPAFSRRLRDAGFDVSEVGVRATGKRSGAHHVIWFATKPDAAD